MRNKVDGTVPKGFMPEDYKESPDSAGKYLINSLEYNEENIALGKKKYLTYCSPCHGNYAKGDSRLKDQFPMPPTLHSKKMNEWADGRIYHVITFGQGVMPSYAKQVTQKERWAIIQYIRTLQRALNPQEDDFNGAK
jgi:mono/diheme cytochrome c family protein